MANKRRRKPAAPRPALRRRRHHGGASPERRERKELARQAREAERKRAERSAPAPTVRDVRADRGHRGRRRVLPAARGEPSPDPAGGGRCGEGGRVQRRPDAEAERPGRPLAPRTRRELHVRRSIRRRPGPTTPRRSDPAPGVLGTDPGDEGRAQPRARRGDHVLPAAGDGALSQAKSTDDDDREQSHNTILAPYDPVAGRDRARAWPRGTSSRRVRQRSAGRRRRRSRKGSSKRSSAPATRRSRRTARAVDRDRQDVRHVPPLEHLMVPCSNVADVPPLSACCTRDVGNPNRPPAPS